MSDPLVTPDDLSTYLSDERIDEDRAFAMIADAQILCESIVSPLPLTAAVVVKRVAGRAYSTTMSPRQAQAAAAGGMFASAMSGGVYLTQSDRADLRRLSGGGGSAFSIDLLPTGYVAPTAPYPADALGIGWDQIA